MGGLALAERAVAIATGVGHEVGLAALLAAVTMPAQSRGAASQQRIENGRYEKKVNVYEWRKRKEREEDAEAGQAGRAGSPFGFLLVPRPPLKQAPAQG